MLEEHGLAEKRRRGAGDGGAADETQQRMGGRRGLITQFLLQNASTAKLGIFVKG